MILTELSIHNLRNIVNEHFTLAPKFNLIVGPNGSGKTSVLEAMYLLSCGHSFRAREIGPLITRSETLMTLFARSEDSQTVSIQKSISSPTLIKLNNQFCRTTSELAYALPSLVVYADVFEIINAGPSVRRSILDWGMFHVKHSFLALWKNYKHVLKQRNALLRARASYQQFIPWDEQLALLAVQIDALRKEYFVALENCFQTILSQLTKATCSISYYKGWDKKNTGKELLQILKESFESDCQRGYTQYGSHQADIMIASEDINAKQGLSRGQQKMVLLALKFAQGKLLDNDLLYLLDDFSAELDENHLNFLMQYMQNIKGQFVLTSTRSQLSLVSDCNLIQLEYGKIHT